MIGKTISHYKILEKLGEGGMGVVYKAEDTKLDRHVAIKFLPQHLSKDEQATKRFTHEAKAASALDHSNIGTIYEIDKSRDGQTFIVMAYYEGETLRERIDRGGMNVEEALDITSQITSGLARAHEQGIVHRDIKPSNIIITKHGEAKIVDFGLAKLTGKTRLTKDGSMLGTVAYMSPEQAKGDEVDKRSDIFSLGVVFYEMLTGQLPFRGEHEAALLYEIVHEEPEPLTAKRAEMSVELERIINKTLNKSANDRYQNTGDLLNDLTALKKGLDFQRSGERRGVAASGVRRAKIRVWQTVALAIVVVVVILIAWKFLRQFRAVPPDEGLAVAVVDFRDLGNPDDVTRSAGITALVQVGLVESSPCRVVSPQYLYDLRRRLFGAGRGPIEEDQALEVARKSGAAMLLSGQMVTLGANPYVTWQLVDTQSGKSLDARRVEGETLATLADQIITDVLPLLAKECGVEEPTPPPPVSELTTASPEAYEHYTAGLLARERLNPHDAVLGFEQAVKLDSTFALAYFELSQIYGYFGEHGPTHDNADKAWRYRARLGIKDRLRLEAWRDQMKGRITDAIAIYREMLMRWPDDKEVLKELSFRLWYNWYFDEALPVARQGLALYPDEWAFANWGANSLAILGRSREALEVSRSYAEQHPGEARAWIGTARLYLVMGLPDSAETASRRAFDIDPNYYYFLRYISYGEYYRGNLQLAIENLERLVARSDLLAGQRISLLTASWMTPNLSLLYAESGRFQKALELCEEARQFVSDQESEITIEVERNRLLLRLGRAEEVLRWARDVTGHSDSRRSLRHATFFKARALVSLDSLEAARSAQAKYRTLTPAFGRTALFPLSKVGAEIALAEKDPEAALAILQEMKRHGMPQRAGWWTIEWREDLAHAHRMAGHLDEAAKVHEEMLRIFRGHTLSHYDLGQIYEEMGRTEDAISEYTLFLNAWKDADEGLPQVEDAKARLAKLKEVSAG